MQGFAYTGAADDWSARARKYDLRRAATHEAGHAAAAARFGIETSTELWPNPAGGKGELYVLGRTWMLGAAPAPAAATMIALAGSIAELCIGGDDAPDVDEVVETLAAGEAHFSRADARLAGDWTPEDVVRCIALVREVWPEIQRRAQVLVQQFGGALSTPSA